MRVFRYLGSWSKVLPSRSGTDRLAVDAVAVHQVPQAGVIGQHRSAVAVAAQRLGREEAGGGDIGPMQRVMAVQRAAETLGAVGDQLQALAVADRLDRRVVGGLAEQVDGDHHLGRQLALGLHGGDGGFELGRVEIVGVGQDVHEHRGRIHPRHDFRRRGEGEGGAEHRVALAHAPGHQRQGDGVGAVGAGQGQPGLAEFGQLGLELTNLRAHDIGAAVQHLGDGGVDLVADPALLRGEVDEGHAHGRSL